MSLLASPTLNSLLTDVRNLLGQPNSDNSYWSDFEITQYINEGVRIYFAQVVKNYEGYFTVSTDPNAGGSGNLTYTANNELVALPTDCFQIRALYIQRPQGWSLLEYRNDVTHGYWTNTGNGSPNIYQPYYFFQGNNIVLRPVPNVTGTNALKLDYIQMPDQMVNGGDSLTNQISPVFKQLLVMYAVYKAKIKQSMVSGTDLTAIAKANLNEIFNSFKDAIMPRTASPRYTDTFDPEIY